MRKQLVRLVHRPGLGTAIREIACMGEPNAVSTAQAHPFVTGEDPVIVSDSSFSKDAAVLSNSPVRVPSSSRTTAENPLSSRKQRTSP